MKQLWSVSCLLAALCASVTVCSSGASAQAVLSGDGGFAVPVKVGFAGSGGGFSARLGRRVGIRNFWETPELVFNYAMFGSGSDDIDPNGFKIIRGLLGVRLTTSGILRPGIFAHAGLGHLSGSVATRMSPTIDISHTAFTWDGGLTLDLAISRGFELGIHGSYNHVLGPGTRVTFRWLEMGGHLAIIL